MTKQQQHTADVEMEAPENEVTKAPQLVSNRVTVKPSTAWLQSLGSLMKYPNLREGVGEVRLVGGV